MSGLLISSVDKNDLKLFIELAKRIGINTKVLSDDDLLDMGLLEAMKEGKNTKFVSRERIMKKLTGFFITRQINVTPKPTLSTFVSLE